MTSLIDEANLLTRAALEAPADVRLLDPGPDLAPGLRPDAVPEIAPKLLPDGEAELDLDQELAGLTAAATAVPAPSDHGRSRRVVQIAVLSLPVLILACLAWTHRNMFVDGFVYLHVVQNILAGHGPVFNVGQRIEAVTSPAWTLVLTVGGLLTPFPLTWVAVVLGIILTVAGVIVALNASTKLARRASPGSFVLPLGATLFVALPPVCPWPPRASKPDWNSPGSRPASHSWFDGAQMGNGGSPARAWSSWAWASSSAPSCRSRA